MPLIQASHFICLDSTTYLSTTRDIGEVASAENYHSMMRELAGCKRLNLIRRFTRGRAQASFALIQGPRGEKEKGKEKEKAHVNSSSIPLPSADRKGSY